MWPGSNSPNAVATHRCNRFPIETTLAWLGTDRDISWPADPGSVNTTRLTLSRLAQRHPHRDGVLRHAPHDWAREQERPLRDGSVQLALRRGAHGAPSSGGGRQRASAAFMWTAPGRETRTVAFEVVTYRTYLVNQTPRPYTRPRGDQ